MDGDRLPSRAFDNPRQRDQTEKAISEYNELLHVSPGLDAELEAIASDRIREDPVRYYLGLPILRVLDMWLRPRTEMLPCDSRWWEFNDEPKWSALAFGFGALNLGCVICALVGWLRYRRLPLTGLLVLFVIL